ncbi:maltose ABC transporter permease MalF [Uliginosibacterium gangwonense]|uniref:maltose ABC transporter permease MalF n=1 Tax=Uliginosibacterium gangwonense TaxID=392736 RepID=UPI00036E3E84|nr:maltose ABC transporter permease MalF [Uliginosibacterium gangwonense]
MTQIDPPPRSWRLRLRTWMPVVIGIVLLLAGLYLVTLTYVAGQTWIAVGLLGLLMLATWLFTSAKTYVYRYLFPGIVAVLIFVLLPIVYTFGIGFTNYSSRNLLSFERSTRYLLEEKMPTEGVEYAFTLHALGKAPTQDYRIRLEDAATGKVYLSPEFALAAKGQKAQSLKAELQNAETALPDALQVRELIALQPGLKLVSVVLPDGVTLGMTGLRRFVPLQSLYKQVGKNLVNQRTGDVLVPDFKLGFYVNQKTGETMTPGFKVGVGFENFRQIFTDPKYREPFLRIFIWTNVFALLSVLFSFGVGIVLAVLMNWEALRFRAVYRTMLFLPYAVPGFISILVFRGLFNESFGEINLILNGLFGISPSWFSDPWLAKAMILIVNTWLGYPYMMLLCMGLIKSIPSDLYEASAIVGSGPLTNFFKITLPLIARPIMPLLISSFAFNFNNFVLISLLTAGGPDYLDTKVPAGSTDILVSYTYRIAFVDSGQNFALAAAISTVIFALVAVMSVLQLRLTKADKPINT